MKTWLFSIIILILVCLSIVGGQIYLYFARKLDKEIEEGTNDKTKNDL